VTIMKVLAYKEGELVEAQSLESASLTLDQAAFRGFYVSIGNACEMFVIMQVQIVAFKVDDGGGIRIGAVKSSGLRAHSRKQTSILAGEAIGRSRA